MSYNWVQTIERDDFGIVAKWRYNDYNVSVRFVKLRGSRTTYKELQLQVCGVVDRMVRVLESMLVA